MNHIYRKNPFWSLAGPLLAYWGIQLAVEFVIQFIIQAPYISELLLEMMSSGEELSIEAYLAGLAPAYEMLIRYQAEITGVSALCTLPLTVLLFRKDRELEKSLGIEPAVKIPLLKYWPIAVFAAAGSIGVTCLSAMAQAALYDAEYQQAAQSIYASPFLIQILTVGIIIPLAEEFMFRGILFKRHRENQKFWYSAIWSSVFFSLMHTNTIQMIYSFLLGLLLCYLYERFGSFKAPAALHIALNLWSLVSTEAGVFAWLSKDPLRMAVAVIISAFICSAMFVYIQQMTYRGREDPPEEKKNFGDLF